MKNTKILIVCIATFLCFAMCKCGDSFKDIGPPSQTKEGKNVVFCKVNDTLFWNNRASSKIGEYFNIWDVPIKGNTLLTFKARSPSGSTLATSIGLTIYNLSSIGKYEISSLYSPDTANKKKIFAMSFDGESSDSLSEGELTITKFDTLSTPKVMAGTFWVKLFSKPGVLHRYITEGFFDIGF